MLNSKKLFGMARAARQAEKTIANGLKQLTKIQHKLGLSNTAKRKPRAASAKRTLHTKKAPAHQKNPKRVAAGKRSWAARQRAGK